jgi:hypothetical protein
MERIFQGEIIMGIPGNRGDYGPVIYPDRFNTTTGWIGNVKKTAADVLVFDNISPSQTTVSDIYEVGASQGFTVYKSGTGSVTVSASSDGNNWVSLHVLNTNPTDVYSNSDPHVFIQISVAGGVSGITVWLFRKYATY